MRAIGLDLGSVRIGVAVCDAEGSLALPSTTLTRAASWAEDHSRIAELVAESGAEVVVVGLPLSMDGRCGPAAQPHPQGAVSDEEGPCGTCGDLR
ncbi:MAG: Holliday junction resolvase RuvX [Microthrixaceae bacterium]|nr:Holliday junction resolvase RuvX [Microthrixaceae bacterium]